MWLMLLMLAALLAKPPPYVFSVARAGRSIEARKFPAHRLESALGKGLRKRTKYIFLGGLAAPE